MKLKNGLVLKVRVKEHLEEKDKKQDREQKLKDRFKLYFIVDEENILVRIISFFFVRKEDVVFKDKNITKVDLDVAVLWSRKRGEIEKKNNMTKDF